MRASVVIRTFNSERTIEQVLEAVRSQNFADYELVIVDSGSTDGTLQILEGYPHTFIDYSDREFTYSGSLNAGCEAARGEYVVCLSSHTIPLSEDWLLELVSAMDSNENIAGAWGPLFLQEGDHVGGSKGEVELIDLRRFLDRANWGLQNPNSIIRRSLWKEHHFSEEVSTCEDQEWAHHFLKRGYYTAMVRGAPVLYKIPHSPYRYGKKMMEEFLVLHELFGYRSNVSTPALLQGSAQAAGAMALGRKNHRAGVLLLSSLAGRWAAEKTIQYRRVREWIEHSPEPGAIALTKLLSSRSRRELQKVSSRFRSRRSRGGRPTDKTYFFVVGEMRSGTTWLARTLNAHPEVFCKGEGSFFGRAQRVEEIPVYTEPAPSLYNALAGCSDFRLWHSLMWNSWGKEGEDEEDLQNITRLVIEYYLAKDSAASGKKIIGDKSPVHTDYVGEIHDLFPEAKVIHIVRDGRDVAVSQMHHFWRLATDQGGIFELEPEELEKRGAYYADPQGFLASGNSIFTEKRLRQMAVRWGRRVMSASREGGKRFGESFYQLRYEDLLQDTEEHLSEILALLGARSDERTVRRCVEENRFERLARRSKGQESSSSFFRKGVAGEWRGVFTRRDREIYEEIAGEVLEEMGYPS